MAQSTPNKKQLRSVLRQRRRALDPEEHDSAATQIALHAQTLPTWTTAQHIAVYRDCDGEIGSSNLVETSLAQGKRIYFPVIGDNNALEFARWFEGEPLQHNRFGIAEPLPSAQRCPTGDLDILFMPLVGWDRSGNRLGMGGGYYDRALQAISGPVLVGLAYSNQEVEEIPRESWDISLDIVLTECGIYTCPRGQTRCAEQAIPEE
jgi:5-formyltetrahydrofolate cyclo-ligase